MDEFAPQTPDEQAAYDLAHAKGIAAGYLFRIQDERDQKEAALHKATHDQMTGLLNKEGFRSALEERLAEAERESRIIGVLFIDLKDFKMVNDKFGHSEGDRIIIASAQLVANTVRENGDHPDVVANEPRFIPSEAGRLGGDEIAVLLDLTPEQDNQKRTTSLTPRERLQSVHDKISENFHARTDIVDTGVDISIGGAIHESGESAAALLDRADKAMYENKQVQIAENGAYDRFSN